MLVRYYELNKQKKEIELEMNQLKDSFQTYFNHLVGSNLKGEITVSGYKLQRQVRKMEKYIDEETIKRLEELHMNDLIQIVKKPDDGKIKAALELGLLSKHHLEGCITTTFSPAISVKPITPR
jgi:site-specific recombinase XerC